MRIGKISQILFPYYSHCHRCKTTWNLVKGVSIQIDSQEGLFHLCENCWDECTVNERIKYYINNLSGPLTDEQISNIIQNIKNKGV